MVVYSFLTNDPTQPDLDSKPINAIRTTAWTKLAPRTTYAYASILCTSVGSPDLTWLTVSCMLRPSRDSDVAGSEGLCTIFFAICATFETEPWRSRTGGALAPEVPVLGGKMGSVECETVGWFGGESGGGGGGADL